MNWQQKIDELVRIRASASRGEGGPFRPGPNPPATVEDLLEVSGHLGEELDSIFAQFLLAANGWTDLIGGADLFSTSELSGGSRLEEATGVVAAYDSIGTLSDMSGGLEFLLAIADCEYYLNTICLVLSGGVRPGSILWISGSGVLRYADFREFWEKVVDWNIMNIESNDS